MNNIILCPSCQHSSHIPLFRCLRCGANLIRHLEASGNQIVLLFEGGMKHSIVVYELSQPLNITECRIEGLKVHLRDERGETKEASAKALFQVLSKPVPDELWNLDEQ